MTWCLVKSEAKKFKKALRDGTIDPVKLADMPTSAERRAFFTKFTDESNAKHINSLFEAKLLLKNQQRGYITWAKKIVGITPEVRRDLISRIEKMDKVLDPAEGEQFLEDLASRRLGFGVTQKEAKTIMDLSKKKEASGEVWTSKLKKNPEWQENAPKTRKEWITDPNRLQHGADLVALENYVNELKLRSKKVSFRGQPLEYGVNVIKEVPGALKSTVASIDNSFFGRQGIKTLLDPLTTKIWVRDFAKSFVDIGKELKSGNAIDAIKADIYSRPYAVSGKYRAGGYGLDVLSEEAFPSSLPEKIPLLGRLYKASEVAYNGGALRMRADLADNLIAHADKNRVNTLDKKQAQPLGHLISSLTGRGSIGKAEAIGKELNVLLFSVKFAKANFDTLTAHMFDKKVRQNKFARKEAAFKTMRIVSTIASLLFMAKLLDPDSVDEDPRSTNFGKIKAFGHWVDITGGMASLTVLASRLVPSKHNGKWGWWYKSSAGNYIELGKKYGGLTALDVAENFFEGKLSPVAGIFRDVWKGKTFSGEPVTLKGELYNVTTPISIQSYRELMQDPGVTSVDMVGLMMLDIFGLSVSTYLPGKFNWNSSTGKILTQFRKEVGEKNFKEANDKFNERYIKWLNKTTKTTEYKNLSDDGKSAVRKKANEIIKDQVFDEYGFKYKKNKKTDEEKAEKKLIKNLTKELKD